MADIFAVGGVVQLKSGGEAMTIEAIEGDRVWLVWFEGKKIQERRKA